METNCSVSCQRYGMRDIGFAWDTGRAYEVRECGTEYSLEHRFTKTRIQLLLVVVSKIILYISN